MLVFTVKAPVIDIPFESWWGVRQASLPQQPPSALPLWISKVLIRTGVLLAVPVFNRVSLRWQRTLGVIEWGARRKGRTLSIFMFLILTHFLLPQMILASVQILSPLAGPTCQNLQVRLCIIC